MKRLATVVFVVALSPLWSACGKNLTQPSAVSRTHTVAGTVRDSETGAPIAGVGVAIGAEIGRAHV